MSTLTTLRGSVARIEAQWRCVHAWPVWRFGACTLCRMRRCRAGLVHRRGCTRCLPRGCRAPRRAGSLRGLRGGVTARRPLVWVRQDFTEMESGALSASGLAELGLNPRLLVTVRASDVDSALRTAADALVCDTLGAVVLEVWGQARQLDLVASRKLTLAAQVSRRHLALLRVAAVPQPSTAETRWSRAFGVFTACAGIGFRCVGRACLWTRSLFAPVMALWGGGSWNGTVMSAFSRNRRRILSLWLPRLPTDRIKRQLARTNRRAG